VETTPRGFIAQATAYSRMLSPDCNGVVALYQVEIYLVCLEVAGALTTTPTVGKLPSYMCYTLVAKFEITSDAYIQKKAF
jgi:hypothetical protein